MNWVGKHSISVGYIQMSVLAQTDDAPAFNFVYRAFAPVVFITVVAAACYQLKFDWVTAELWLVVVYQIILRTAFNLATGRRLLINWPMQGAYALVSVPAAYLIYENVILYKQLFLPSWGEIGTALWLGVAAFVYQTFNRVKLSATGTKRRKRRYLEDRYTTFKARYGDAISAGQLEPFQEALAYAIMIYEDFNRPTVYRFVERIAFRFGLSSTLGIMQVKTTEPISDTQSVGMAIEKLRNDFVRAKPIVQQRFARHGGAGSVSNWALANEVISLYNGGSQYQNEVGELHQAILEAYYPNAPSYFS